MQVIVAPFSSTRHSESDESVSERAATDSNYSRWRIISVDNDIAKMYAMDKFDDFENALKHEDNDACMFVSYLEIPLRNVFSVSYFLGESDVLNNNGNLRNCDVCSKLLDEEKYVITCDGTYPIVMGNRFRCHSGVACENCGEANSTPWLCSRCIDTDSFSVEDVYGHGIQGPIGVHGGVIPGTRVCVEIKQYYDAITFVQPATAIREDNRARALQLLEAQEKYKKFGGVKAIAASASVLAVARQFHVDESHGAALDAILHSLDDICNRDDLSNPLPRSVTTLVRRGECLLGSSAGESFCTIDLDSSSLQQVQKKLKIEMLSIPAVLQEMFNDKNFNDAPYMFSTDTISYTNESDDNVIGPEPWMNTERWTQLTDTVPEGGEMLALNVWSDATCTQKGSMYPLSIKVRTKVHFISFISLS